MIYHIESVLIFQTQVLDAKFLQKLDLPLLPPIDDIIPDMVQHHYRVALLHFFQLALEWAMFHAESFEKAFWEFVAGFVCEDVGFSFYFVSCLRRRIRNGGQFYMKRSFRWAGRLGFPLIGGSSLIIFQLLYYLAVWDLNPIVLESIFA